MNLVVTHTIPENQLNIIPHGKYLCGASCTVSSIVPEAI